MTVKKHYSRDELQDYLDNKHSIPSELQRTIKDHLDFCQQCWEKWNKVRWDKALDSRGMAELKEYLGDNFKAYYDSSWALANEWKSQNPKTPEEVANFYKHTNNYLFNLIVWYESGDREFFQDDFEKMRDELGVKSVIDYGCGVGNDGLYLLEHGFEVYFVDYECPSTEFLKWRLKKRGLQATILNVEEVKMLPKVDMFWAIDVLEHVIDPCSVLEKIHPDTKVITHRSQFNDDAGGRHPCHFNFEELKLVRNLKNMSFNHVPWAKLSVWLKNH